MKLYAGTSGFSYAEWKGSFYPDDLPAGEMLRFYADRLPAVEINNTFYRLPRASVLTAWGEQVPADFRFALKASRRITHIKRLRDAESETEYLLRVAEALGERLGPILFQLPPNLKADLPRLQAFIALLPQGVRAAFEFRHPSWSELGVREALRGRGCAMVIDDTEEAPAAEIEATTDWGYLRLRRQDYDAAALAAWAQRIAGQSWSEAYVFFKHEEAGAGPRLAADFLALRQS
ncbi:MAG TPA: DUF72 domain-containing protein [Thermoanaerobaculia bacterium]|nr:DUF72 domain-containing protein [Thermoanaerobaculia bacterium]